MQFIHCNDVYDVYNTEVHVCFEIAIVYVYVWVVFIVTILINIIYYQVSVNV